MRIYRAIAIVFGALLMSGCGDQVWCGENGCQDTTKAGNVTGGQQTFIVGGAQFR